MPVLKNEFVETTALGAARLSGLVTGFYKKEDFLKDTTTKYTPSMDSIDVKENYDRWKKAVQACRNFK